MEADGCTVGGSADDLRRGHLASLRSTGWQMVRVTNCHELGQEVARREQLALRDASRRRNVTPLRAHAAHPPTIWHALTGEHANRPISLKRD